MEETSPFTRLAKQTKAIAIRYSKYAINMAILYIYFKMYLSPPSGETPYNDSFGKNKSLRVMKARITHLGAVLGKYIEKSILSYKRKRIGQTRKARIKYAMRSVTSRSTAQRERDGKAQRFNPHRM